MTAKDLILALIGHVGAAGGTGYAVEYAGSAIRDMPIEGRLTVCNLSIELGAKIGMIAPDETDLRLSRAAAATRRKARCGERAVAAWRQLAERPRRRSSTARCVIDVDDDRAAGHLGHQPGARRRRRWPHVPIRQRSPIRHAAPRWRPRSTTWGLRPGAPIAGTPVDWVFIGSCTNSRSQRPARRRRGRARPQGCAAACAPGWCRARRRSSATPWPRGSTRFSPTPASNGASRAARCALPPTARPCAPGQRSVSTSNRNFVGRQGPRARTHLASPAMAAAAAIAGRDRRRADAWSAEMPKPFTTLTAIAAPHHAQQHRHRRHHPHRAAGRQLGSRHARQMGVRRAALSAGRLGKPRLHPQPRALPAGGNPGRRPELRLRLVARRRGVVAAGNGHPRRHRLRASATSSSPTASRTASCRSSSTRRSSMASPPRSSAARAPGASASIWRRRRSRSPSRQAAPLRHRSAPPRRPARRSRRNRADAAARRRHPRLSGRATAPSGPGSTSQRKPA